MLDPELFHFPIRNQISQFNDVYLIPAGMDDAEKIRSIAIETYLETFSDNNNLLNVRFGDNFLRNYKKELASEFVQYIFVKQIGTDKIIGYAKIILEKEQACLDKFYLLQEFHRRKIGTYLLSKLFEEVLSKKITKMYLATNADNKRAISFYIKNGFYKTKQFVPPVPGSHIMSDIIMRCDNIAVCNQSIARKPKL